MGTSEEVTPAPCGPTADHTCRVAFAKATGLLAGSPVDDRWCLSSQRENVLSASTAKDPKLQLWSDGRLSIHYAPFEWVNTQAKLMLVGICPGAQQAEVALRELKRCLQAGLGSEDALRAAKAAGAFAGAIRANLIAMLDGIGMAEALGIDSTRLLFSQAGSGLAERTSAISYPVFVGGRDYSGRNPPLTGHPVLRSLVVASAGAAVAMAPDAMVVPLGQAASEGVELLVSMGLLERGRCLFGFPHPSGANGWRARKFADNRPSLRRNVERFFSGQHTIGPGGLSKAGGLRGLNRPTAGSGRTGRTSNRPVKARAAPVRTWRSPIIDAAFEWERANGRPVDFGAVPEVLRSFGKALPTSKEWATRLLNGIARAGGAERYVSASAAEQEQFRNSR
jgi:hypothetical protein